MLSIFLIILLLIATFVLGTATGFVLAMLGVGWQIEHGATIDPVTKHLIPGKEE